MNFDLNRRPLIIIAGPTASGKTAVSVDVARKIGAECISADSVQVYKGLNIGSAKVTELEMHGIRHHLIDVLEPVEHYDVVRFQRMAEDAIDDIYSRSKIPILVGGTGFYIQALLYGIDFSLEGENIDIRRRLESIAETEGGSDILYERLQEVDPKSIEKIHKHNIRRVIRALEYYEAHGSPISEHNEMERQKEAVYDALFFVLTDDRKKLYDRIDRRVDKMIEDGLLSEVQSLYDSGLRASDSVMQGIGYREVLSYLEGQYDLSEAIELVKKHSRNYAKRQLTWFRREKMVEWIDISKFNYEKEDISRWIIERCMKRWA